MSGVTLVGTSGKVVISRMSFEVRDDAALTMVGPESHLRVRVQCRVPTGEYIVVPGSFFGTPVQWRVIAAARSGQLKELFAKGEVPRVVFLADTTTTAVIDTAAAQAALLGN